MKPILFNTQMVKAILNGKKTMTRRIMNPQPIEHNSIFTGEDALPLPVAKYAKLMKKWQKKGFSRLCVDGILNGYLMPKAMAYQDDILWVRETFAKLDISGDGYSYVYKASNNGTDWAENSEDWKWKPSLFMPMDAARIFLQVESLKFERIQDISEEDAQKEGVGSKEEFKQLWISINGEKSWNDNPYVFVYTFKIKEIKYNDYETI